MKIELQPVTNTDTISTINANFALLEAEFQDKVLYRDNPLGETNTVTNNLDLDGNDVFNVNTVRTENLFVNDVDINDFTSAGAIEAAEQAEAAAALATIAANNANGAATAAGTQATSALEAANDAADSAAAAAGAVTDAIPGILSTANGYTDTKTAAERVYTDSKVTALASPSSPNGSTLVGYNYNAVGTNITVRDALNFSEVNVKMFGAVGNGSTDDRNAFVAAINFCTSTGKGLFVPAGTYALSAAITTTSGNISIRGESRGASILFWPSSASTVGLNFNLIGMSGTLSESVNISNLSFTTGKSLAGNSALTVTGGTSTSGDRIQSRAIIRDVIIRGATIPTLDGFVSGLRLTNCTNSLVDGLTFIGKVNGSEPNYSSSYAILYDNGNGASPHAVGCTITNCFLTYAFIGIDTYDFEGVLVSNCQIIGVDTGVNFDGPNTFPHASVMNTHINAATRCIRISRMYQVLVQGCVLYNEIGTFTGEAIHLLNGACYANIQGNIIENLKTNYNMNGVVLDSGSNFNIVSNNVFRRTNSGSGAVNGVGVWLQAGANNNKTVYNIFDQTTTSYLNSGTGNTVV